MFCFASHEILRYKMSKGGPGLWGWNPKTPQGCVKEVLVVIFKSFQISTFGFSTFQPWLFLSPINIILFYFYFRLFRSWTYFPPAWRTWTSATRPTLSFARTTFAQSTFTSDIWNKTSPLRKISLRLNNFSFEVSKLKGIIQMEFLRIAFASLVTILQIFLIKLSTRQPFSSFIFWNPIGNKLGIVLTFKTCLIVNK